MKALQVNAYGEIKDSLAFNEVAKPNIQAKDLLIEVKAAAINPIDKVIILGYLKGMIPIPMPSTLAYDVSGIVVEIGADVKGFEIGDAVYSRVPQGQMGTLTQFVAVDNTVVAKKPENVSFEEAASIPLAGLTAFQCLEHVGIKANDKVLIHAGSGGVGSFAIQYAKSKGAYVYTTTSTENVEWVKALGADRVIDYKKEDYKTIVTDADSVFDTLGKEYSTDAFGVLKVGGRVVSIAGPMDEATAHAFGMADYKLPEDLAKVIETKKASYKFIWMHPSAEDLTTIKGLMEAGKIKAVIDTVYPFVESIAAFEHLATGRAKGKIVIKMN